MTSNVKGSVNTEASNILTGTLDGDRLPALSETKKGGVPATGTPSGKFLKDNNTWASAGGAGTPSESVTYETSFGESPDAGASDDYSRGDHTHGTPANPVTDHESTYTHSDIALNTGARHGQNDTNSSCEPANANIQTHVTGTGSPHTAAGIGAESAGAVATHSGLATGVHNVGGSTVASVANIATHAGVTSSVHNFDSSGNAPAQTHDNAKHSATYITSGGVTDALLITSDVTTNDVSTSKHGFAPKITNTSNYLKGDGTWSLPTAAAADLNPNLLVQASNYTLNANYGLYITDFYEIANTYYLELSNGSMLEIG